MPRAITVPVQLPRPSSSAAFCCHVCSRMYTSSSALEQHYRDTPVHPKCARCNIGFLDNAGLQAVSTLISFFLFGLYQLHVDVDQSTPPPSIVQLLQFLRLPSLAVFVIGPALTQARSSSTIETPPYTQSVNPATSGSWIMPHYRL